MILHKAIKIILYETKCIIYFITNPLCVFLTENQVNSFLEQIMAIICTFTSAVLAIKY